MTKSEVYSWRLSPELKMDLEAAAREEKSSVSAILERLAREWLRGRKSPISETEQERLRAALMACAGTISLGEGPYTNKRVREFITAKLEARYKRTASTD